MPQLFALPTVSTSGAVTPTAYFLTTGATNTANTVAASVQPLGKLTPPVSATLWDYSTDLANIQAGMKVTKTSGSALGHTHDFNFRLTA